MLSMSGRLADRLKESNGIKKSRTIAAAFKWKRWDVEFKLKIHLKTQQMEAFRYLETVLAKNRVIFSLFVSLHVWLKEYETFQPLGTWDGVNLVFPALMCFSICWRERALLHHMSVCQIQNNVVTSPRCLQAWNVPSGLCGQALQIVQMEHLQKSGYNISP